MRQSEFDYVKILTRQIGDKKMRKEIEQEIRNHIQDQVEEYVGCGMDEEEAYQLVIEEMGEPKEVGRQFNKIYSLQIKSQG